MNKEQKRRILSYLFIALAVITIALAYTIETWRWGAAAMGGGLFLIGVLTWIGLNRS